MNEWGIVALAGGIATVVTAMIGYAAFWLNRGKGEATGEHADKERKRIEARVDDLFASREAYRRELDTRFSALHGTTELYHNEMLRDYVSKIEYRQHLKDFEDRFTTTQREVGDRLTTEIKELGRRMDAYLGQGGNAQRS